MSKDESKKRRYTEEEFALILRKASEIQDSPKGGGKGSAGSGLTLEEVQSIATEAGMDPQAVSRAAALLGAMEWEERSGLAAILFGAPGKFHMDFEVPGKLPPEELGRVLELIRRTAEHQGEAAEVLGGVEWKTVGELSAINVNITPRGDATSIQIVGDRSGAGAVTFTFPMAGAAILVGALGAAFEPTSTVGIVSLISGVLGSGFLVARTLWVTGGRRFHKKLSRLMDVVSTGVQAGTVPPFELGAVEEEPGIRAGRVARKLGVPRSSVTRALPAVEEAGLLLSEDGRGGLWPWRRDP